MATQTINRLKHWPPIHLFSTGLPTIRQQVRARAPLLGTASTFIPCELSCCAFVSFEPKPRSRRKKLEGEAHSSFQAAHSKGWCSTSPDPRSSSMSSQSLRVAGPSLTPLPASRWLLPLSLTLSTSKSTAPASPSPPIQVRHLRHPRHQRQRSSLQCFKGTRRAS